MKIFLIPFFESIENPMSLGPIKVPKEFQYHDIEEGDMSALICSTTQYIIIIIYSYNENETKEIDNVYVEKTIKTAMGFLKQHLLHITVFIYIYY